jgi:hypothetical protein
MAKTSDKAPKPKVAAKESAQSGANLGFEAKLWLTADKLRNNSREKHYEYRRTELEGGELIMTLVGHLVHHANAIG